MTSTISGRADFDVEDAVSVGSATELAAFFADRSTDAPPVRLCGSASRQRELPAPARAPVLVSLAPMTRITRLEPDDLTCSVEPGIRRAELDAILAEKRVHLPCAPSAGTVGAMFALGRESWPEAPGSLGSIGARTLLLGLSGVLAEGKRFKAGGRVVKNVAGFDLQKLFVGSRGMLFAATELHLKLRPLPRATAAFTIEGLALDEALAKLRALRLDDYPPAAVRLLRCATAPTFVVSGRFEGAARVVADRMRAHGLPEVEAEARELGAHPDSERVAGLVAPSQVGALARLLPARAALRVGGTGAFEAFLSATEADELLIRLPALGAVAELDLAPPDRRGRSTPGDAGAARIGRDVKLALDPGDVLT